MTGPDADALNAALAALTLAGQALQAPRDAMLSALAAVPQSTRDGRRLVRETRTALATLAATELDATHDFCRKVGRLG